MMKAVDPKLDALLNRLASICEPLVRHIEAMPATTKDHYGDYMAAITKVAEMFPLRERNSQVYLAVGLAMQRTGASKTGVVAALQVMGHL